MFHFTQNIQVRQQWRWACNVWFCATHNIGGPATLYTNHQQHINTMSTANHSASKCRNQAQRLEEKQSCKVGAHQTDNGSLGGLGPAPDSHISTTANDQKPQVDLHSLISGAMSALPESQSPSNRWHFTWGTTLLHSCSAVKNLYYSWKSFQLSWKSFQPSYSKWSVSFMYIGNIFLSLSLPLSLPLSLSLSSLSVSVSVSLFLPLSLSLSPLSLSLSLSLSLLSSSLSLSLSLSLSFSLFLSLSLSLSLCSLSLTCFSFLSFVIILYQDQPFVGRCGEANVWTKFPLPFPWSFLHIFPRSWQRVYGNCSAFRMKRWSKWNQRGTQITRCVCACRSIMFRRIVLSAESDLHVGMYVAWWDGWILCQWEKKMRKLREKER